MLIERRSPCCRCRVVLPCCAFLPSFPFFSFPFISFPSCQVASAVHGTTLSQLDVTFNLLPLAGPQLSAADVAKLQDTLPLGGVVSLRDPMVKMATVYDINGPGEEKGCKTATRGKAVTASGSYELFVNDMSGKGRQEKRVSLCDPARVSSMTWGSCYNMF